MKKIWLDLDNAPHVQYIYPVAEAFSKMGYEVAITARDYGQVVGLLKLKKINARVVGRGFGKTKLSKTLNTLARATRLALCMRGQGCAASLSNSRATALASKILSIKNFAFCDFENSELLSYKILGSYLVVPEVISQTKFTDLGFRKERLIRYPGLKEHLSLSSISELPNSCLVGISPGNINIVLRPPSENAHYYRSSTGALFDELEQFLLSNLYAHGLHLIFIPRDEDQLARYNLKYRSAYGVTVLHHAVEGLSLIRQSDLVFTGGGTMAREAAVLGRKAYSVFLTPTGDVDRYLQSRGQLTLIRSKEDFAKIDFAKTPSLDLDLASFSDFPIKVAKLIEERICGA